jgi:hypothetical protein
MDFVRGSEANLRSLASIVNDKRLPKYVVEASPLLRDGSIDTQPLLDWLQTSFTGAPGAPQEYMDSLTSDTPLLLFIMFEAAATVYPRNAELKEIQEGQCLGAIGSFIIAEFLFGEYWRTHDLIENDPAAKAALDQLFGPQVPASMPALIEEIARRKGWDGPDTKFW